MASVLDFLGLSDRYERKARLLPGLITAAVFLPSLAVLSSEAFGFVTGVSLASVIGVAGAFLLAYVASALGRSYERRVWPRAPYDMPTNRWLHPSDATVSRQQKQRWYGTIKSQLGLDIAAGGPDSEEQELVINDAVRALRNRFRVTPKGSLLQIQNEDYGFVRNLVGLRIVWLPGAVVSVAITWTAYFVSDASIIWGIAATAIVALALLCYVTLPRYVEDRATRYTESFFGALDSIEPG